MQRETQAVLLDAMGTLVELEPPWEHLAPALGVEPAAARRAFGAEMSFYRENAGAAVDAPSLARLRERCAAVLSSELGTDVGVEPMMAAIRFRAFADAEPGLRALRAAGVRLVCVSNWDFALGEVLERVGLAGHLDAVVTSAGAGAAKPDPAIFAVALEAASCPADAALHVGDTEAEDVAGARAAGIRALLLDRGGAGDIASLEEIAARL